MPSSNRRKCFRGIDIFEFDLKILAEDALHDLGFVFAQEPIVDEDAGELIPNRLVQKSRCDEESTPPLKPRTTFSSPTCCRTRSQDSSMKDPIVQSIEHWQTRKRKFSMISFPRGVCETSGMKLQREEPGARCLRLRQRRNSPCVR
jgi:hypothetical protein